MLAKASFDSGGKRIVRAKLKDFVSNHLNGRKWDVLCMPSHEAFEIEQTWDQLNVPHDRIVAVENRPAAAEMISLKFPNINIVRGDLKEYLERSDQMFNVMHLNFCGGL